MLKSKRSMKQAYVLYQNSIKLFIFRQEIIDVINMTVEFGA
jgi:hypothetical protein